MEQRIKDVIFPGIWVQHLLVLKKIGSNWRSVSIEMEIDPVVIHNMMDTISRVDQYSEAHAFLNFIYRNQPLKKFLDAMTKLGYRNLLLESGIIVEPVVQKIYLADIKRAKLDAWFRKYQEDLGKDFLNMISYFETATNFRLKDLESIRGMKLESKLFFYYELLINRRITVLHLAHFLRKNGMEQASDELIYI